LARSGRPSPQTPSVRSRMVSPVPSPSLRGRPNRTNLARWRGEDLRRSRAVIAREFRAATSALPLDTESDRSDQRRGYHRRSSALPTSQELTYPRSSSGRSFLLFRPLSISLESSVCR
jgi:hypothetical protein